MNFPAYQSYKKTNFSWIGLIPTHWQEDRIKWSSIRCVNGVWGDEPDESQETVTCIRVADFDRIKFTVQAHPSTKRKIDTNQLSSRQLLKGNLLLEKSGGGENQPVGCVVQYQLDEVSVCSNFVARVTLRESMNSRYWTYAHAAIYSAQLNTLAIKQTTGIQNLDSDEYFNLKVGFPPPDEQTQIANFLDKATAKIDTLIAKKRELLELLEEKRRALITRCVTRGLPPDAAHAAGLNPNPKLKPSGIDWLGDIPEHWEVKKLKHVGSVRYGLGEPPEYVDEGLPFIRATDINRGKIEFENVKRVRPEDVPWHRKPKLKEGEILVVRSGAYTGDSAIVSKEMSGCIAGYDMILTIKHSHPDFIAWALLSKYFLEGQIYLERMRAAQPHLNAEELGGFDFLKPPLKEQIIIADFVDQFAFKTDQLVNKTREAIDTLLEYRAALITAAVTGKIDVRGVEVTEDIE